MSFWRCTTSTVYTPHKPVRSTMALINIVSSRRYGLFPASLANGQKSGQPLAMFISLIGRWNEVEVTSGRKASMMCSLLFWSKSIRVTFWLKGHLSRASHLPLITTKKSERWVPLPVPSPFKYKRRHIL